MPPRPPADVERLLEDFLAAEYAESPTMATALGVPGYDDLLPDLSAAGYRRRAEAEDAWAETFAGLADDELSDEQAIDRDLVLATLRGRAIMRDWSAWRRNPDTYLTPGLSGVLSLFVHRLRPEPELAEAAAARLDLVPELLDAGRANVDPELASPLLVRRALGQARAAATYARDLVPAEVADGPDRARLATAGQAAAAAYDDFASFLVELADRAAGDYAIGEGRYSALLREREGLDFGATELRRRGQAVYDELATDLRRRCAELAGHEDWRALLEELNRDHPATPEQMRASYAEWTERAREFCRDRDLVSLPEGEECRVEPSPAFQRPVLAVASYLSPPAFAGSRTGHFFVPYPPDGTSAEEVAKRLETNSFSSIPTISVHEAYPGHHWHFVWLQANARPVRRVFGTSYFTEGWGLYAEEMMRREGFFTDPRHELCQVDARIFRAARIVVDTSLHLGEMTVEEAVVFMSTKASLSEPTARAEVARYCAWPTQAASYLTGSLEIERIRDAYLAGSGGGLKDFHDAIAGSGMLPIALAERAVLGRLSDAGTTASDVRRR